MVSMEDSSFTLRLFVDKERNRVVVAEANGDFVDTLFSFLTLPLGTIVRLTSKNQHPPEIGCTNNLFQSVKKCDTQMLLYPRNPCEKLCQKLKLNVDDTEPTKYWMCGSCVRNNNSCLSLSTFAGANCSCGKVMDQEVKLHEEDSSTEVAPTNGVFVNRNATYMIFDDLEVLQNSAIDSVKRLVQIGYTDFNSLTEMSLNVGPKEILDLLKRALISKSPLSDVLLDVEYRGSQPMCFLKPILIPPTTSAFGSRNTGRSVFPKIIVSKSKNKIMYAEAEAEFLDFLFSFLTIPIGSVLDLLKDNVSLGSMDTLYRSVKGLNSSYFTELSNTPLRNLRVAHQHGCTSQPISALLEMEAPQYYYDYVNMKEVISENNSGMHGGRPITLFDPRSPPDDKRTQSSQGFVRSPSLFVVTDDLQVTPLTSTSSISFLQKLNVPLSDLEEYTVGIDNTEALNVLGASLTSKAALTNGLFYFVKKPKEEATL